MGGGAGTHGRPAFQTQDQSEAAAGNERAHARLRSIQCHICSGEVLLVSADRQNMSNRHDQREIPVTMCAKFDRRTSAASAPSRNTSMKLQGRTCTRMRNIVS